VLALSTSERGDSFYFSITTDEYVHELEVMEQIGRKIKTDIGITQSGLL
jgi:hypothetical protein